MANLSSSPVSRILCAASAMLLSIGGSLSAPPVQADTVDLSPTPPGLTTTVAPNIVVSFDDSGSMLATAMPDAISGKYNSKKYYYSSTSNTIYYNPNIDYKPPVKPDGTLFPDSSYTKAWRDGLCANWPGSYCANNINTVDLSDHFYRHFANGTSTSNAPNETSASQGSIPYQIRGNRYYGGFYYNCPTRYSDSGCTEVKMNDASAAQKQNFANWYSYYRTRNLMTRTSIARAFGTMSDIYRVTWQTINKTQALTSTTKIKQLTGAWRKSFFSFLFNVHSGGSTPDRRAVIRAGKFYERGDTHDDLDPYWNGASGVDSRRLTCRQNFQLLVTDGYWNWGSNPTAPTFGAEDSGTLPDGRAYSTSDNESKIFWNVDGTLASSMANIAFYYWAHDLQPGLDDEVAPYLPDLTTGVTGSNPLGKDDDPLDNKEIYWNPKNDPATWQHMVNFMITLGVAGDLNFPADYDALRTGNKSWPKPRNNSPSAVDDTWHGAVNSRGKYLSAGNPEALEQKLKAVLSSVNQRNSSSVAGSLNTSVLTTGALSFSAGYNSSDWSGDVVAHDVSDEGDIGNARWSADSKLASRDAADRLIATSKLDSGSLVGTPFQWSSLGGSEKIALNTLPDDTTDSNGHARLDWLRGDQSKEGDLFRTRTHLLGAIINSQSVYVAYPASGYRNHFPEKINGVAVDAPEDDAMANDSDDCATNGTCHSYEQFAYDHLDRTPVVYVGANDGMLHAFDASQNADGSPTASAGNELWAYVPHAVYDKLSAQTLKQDYKFVPTVDGTVVHRDVFFSENSHAEWHTILVGSLRLGGRGVYALDITDPSAGNETDVANKVLWEFTAQSAGANPDDPSQANNPANLGFTFGQPNIGRLSNGKWVVLVPGGYFPDCDNVGAPTPCDDSMKAASNKFSSLFILDAQTGKLIRELRTPTTIDGSDIVSSGLASPVLGDYNNDQVSDVAFAGDMEGNLWRFDLSDPDPANWKVNLVYEHTTAAGIDEQAITSMPRLFPDPVGKGFMVVFGTGKFLGLSDRISGSNEPVQSIYGIREPGEATNSSWTRDDLVEQVVNEATATLDGNSVTVRGITNNAVPSSTGGWYFDLPVNGERMVVTPGALFNTNRAIIATLIPGNNDPCNPSRLGAVMVVNAATGGATHSVGLGDVTLPAGWPKGSALVGARVNNPPATGSLPVATRLGGGKDYLPGIGLPGGKAFSISDSIWRRRSWRILNMGE